MTRRSIVSDRKERFLRRSARKRLKAGSAPVSSSPLGGDTLALLYQMASDPERSSDALRLLQELQVYQVELDLQRAQLETNESELGRELALYKSLFQLTPAASLIVTPEGRIVEANPAATDLLGAGRDELAGRELPDFLKPESHTFWNEVLSELKAGGVTASSCEVLAGTGSDDAVKLKLSVKIPPGGDVLLITLENGERVSHDRSNRQRAR